MEVGDRGSCWISEEVYRVVGEVVGKEGDGVVFENSLESRGRKVARASLGIGIAIVAVVVVVMASGAGIDEGGRKCWLPLTGERRGHAKLES